jgi:hypothetical protein
MSVCVRYKGRWLATVNPCTADQSFLFAYVEPVLNPREGVIDEALECTVGHLLAGRRLCLLNTLLLCKHTVDRACGERTAGCVMSLILFVWPVIVCLQH